MTCHRQKILLKALLCLACAEVTANAQTNAVPPWVELKQLTLEQLINEEVITVARRPQKLSQSPSAIQVITGEDIRRSGATLPRRRCGWRPNLEVAQVNSHDWAISARGLQ